MALWTAFEAQAATGGYCAAPWEAHGVSIDTRTLQSGDLFVALTAARDGHDFVAQALEKGAAAALVERRPDGVPETAPLLIVPDVLQALIDLGRAARARCAAKVLAVTGSVGKTSTKEMLRTVLEFQGRTHASVASYNNHWGRAADPGAHAGGHPICHFRNWHESSWRNCAVERDGAAACGNDHNRGPGAYGSL
jgi:UDP-N-acetylmuramoyl-tripeptide--D-alanyl-D-alanine ligase